MDCNTPEEEKALVYDTPDVSSMKHMMDRIRKYKDIAVKDVLVDKEKNKYMVTYIDDVYGLIYGRKICKTGRLSKNIVNITNLYTMMEIDAEQVNSMLLGDDYDPAANAKAITKAKQKIYRIRVKERFTGFKGLSNDELAKLVPKHLSKGQQLWIVYTNDDSQVAHHKCTITNVHKDGITIQTIGDNYLRNIQWHSFSWYNFYFSKPTTYQGQL